MNTTVLPDVLPRIRAAIDAGILTAGNWGDGNHVVCMMSAAVPGAESTDDCVTAGWPKWLSSLNVRLFDARVGADDERKARAEFALAVAEAVSVPRDMNRAHDLFVLATLRSIATDDTGARDAIAHVAALYERRLSGEAVTSDEWAAARAAADAAARAAADAAAAARAAAYAAARDNLIVALTAA